MAQAANNGERGRLSALKINWMLLLPPSLRRAGKMPEKREWCYLQPPAVFEVAPCECGNHDTQWSEFKGHLWCPECQKDFIPMHNGVFDGPIPAELAAMLGITFDRYIIETGEVERYDVKQLGWVRSTEND